MKDKETHTAVADGNESIFAIKNLDADIKNVEEQIAELTERKSELGYKLRSLRSLRKNAQKLKDAGFLQTSFPIDGDPNEDASPVEETAVV